MQDLRVLIAITLSIFGLVQIVVLSLGFAKYYLIPEIRIVRAKYN